MLAIFSLFCGCVNQFFDFDRTIFSFSQLIFVLLAHGSNISFCSKENSVCFLRDVHGSPLHFPSTGWGMNDMMMDVKKAHQKCGYNSTETHLPVQRSVLVAWVPKFRERVCVCVWAVALCCLEKTKNKVIFGVHITRALTKKRFSDMKQIFLAGEKKMMCFYSWGERNENDADGFEATAANNEQHKKDEQNSPCESK